MGAKIFNLSLPEELIILINRQLKVYYTSRNEYIKQAIVARLEAEGALGSDLVSSVSGDSLMPAVPKSKLKLPAPPKWATTKVNADGSVKDVELENFLRDYYSENPKQ